MLSRDALLGALKTVQREYVHAISVDDSNAIRRWSSERNRILSMLNTEETND
jgi:hypothetical protein